MPRPPILTRLFLLAERVVSFLNRLYALIRDETLWAFTSPAKRSRVNVQSYAKDRAYLPGGKYYEKGLFDWERKIFSSPAFAKRGRLILGGAGAGREIGGLCALGYKVTAFEPCSEYVAAGREAAEKFKSVSFYQGSYDDLIVAANDGENSLSNLVRGERFDCGVVGWGSYSHLTDERERVSILRAFHTVVPEGPLLVSFLLQPNVPRGRVERLRPYLRWLYARFGGSSHPIVGDTFSADGMYFHFFTTEEIRKLAEEAGYHVHQLELFPYPHAVLFPQTGRDRS